MNIPWKTITYIVALVLIVSLSGYCWAILFGDFNVLESVTVSAPSFFHTLLGKIVLLLFGLLTLTCALGLLAILLDYEPFQERQVVIENEAGAVGVSLNAVEEFIKRKGKNVTGVRDIQVHATEMDNSLYLQTKLVVELQKNMPEFTKQFHDKIHYELETTLGIQNISHVEVLIQKIFPRDASSEAVMLGPPSKLLLKDSKVPENEKSQLQENQEKEVTPYLEDDHIQDENFTVISKSHTKEG